GPAAVTALMRARDPQRAGSVAEFADRLGEDLSGWFPNASGLPLDFSLLSDGEVSPDAEEWLDALGPDPLAEALSSLRGRPWRPPRSHVDASRRRDASLLGQGRSSTSGGGRMATRSEGRPAPQPAPGQALP